MSNSDVLFWVKKIENQGGRDHLGLKRIGQNKIDEISCGISNITVYGYLLLVYL